MLVQTLYVETGCGWCMRALYERDDDVWNLIA